MPLARLERTRRAYAGDEAKVTPSPGLSVRLTRPFDKSGPTVTARVCSHVVAVFDQRTQRSVCPNCGDEVDWHP